MRAVSVVGMLVLAGCGRIGYDAVHASATDAATSEMLDGTLDATSDGGGDANDQGTCMADLQTSPTNCGTCGHDCLGGACSAGVCQPVALYTGPSSADPVFVAVDATHVYWTESLALKRVPKAGGTVETLASGINLKDLAIDGTTVYFSDFGADTVSKVATTGGIVTTLASGLLNPFGLATDGTDVYFAQNAGANVSKVSKVSVNGGAVTDLATALDWTRDVAIDGNDVFFTNQANNQAMNKVPTAGGVVTPISAATQRNLFAVAVYGGHVYWVENDQTIWRAPTSATGPGQEVAIATGLGSLWDIAVDASGVYFTAWATGGSLRHVDHSGGAVTTLVAGLTTGRGIATDATAIYYLDAGTDTVMRLAK